MSGRLVPSLSPSFSLDLNAVFVSIKEVIKPQIYHFHVKVERDTEGEESKKKTWGVGAVAALLVL